MQTLQGLWRSHSRFHLHAQCCQQGIYRGRPGGSSHQPSTQALSSRSVDSTWCEMSWRHRMRPFGDVTKFRACEREEIAWVQGCVLTYCFSSVISELFEYKIHRPLCTELLCAWVACSQITLTRIQYSIVGIRLFIFNLLVSIWFPYFKFKQKKKNKNKKHSWCYWKTKQTVMESMFCALSIICLRIWWGRLEADNTIPFQVKIPIFSSSKHT